MTARTSRLIRATLINATVIATLGDDALNALALGLPGFPAQTPGASPGSGAAPRQCNHRDSNGDNDCDETSPCPTHDPDGDQGLTLPERLATTPDTAGRDLQAFTDHVRLMAHHAARAATIAHRWGLEGVDDTTVKAGLKASVKERIDEIWCTNCAASGISTVHRIGRTECGFCESFRLTGACGLRNPNNYPAPKGLLDVHFSRRLDSSDVIRTMTAAYGFGWNRKTTKKGKGKTA